MERIGVVFEIYGTDNCSFCNKAKDLLREYDKPYVYVNISESPETQQAFFKKFPNVNRVPQISLDDGFHIGGYKELEKWLLNRTA